MRPVGQANAPGICPDGLSPVFGSDTTVGEADGRRFDVWNISRLGPFLWPVIRMMPDQELVIRFGLRLFSGEFQDVLAEEGMNAWKDRNSHRKNFA